jgi:hypothetical protein
MAPLKQSVSSRATRLTARLSPYHSSVTLVECQGSAEAAAGYSSDTYRRSKRVKLGESTENLRDLEDVISGPKGQAESAVSSPSISKNRKLKSPRKPKSIQQSLGTPHPAPERWQETYDTIKEMRSHIVAPVDTMGCDQAQFKEKEPKVRNVPLLAIYWVSDQTFALEPKIRDARLANAVFTDKGRSDWCGCFKT